LHLQMPEAVLLSLKLEQAGHSLDCFRVLNTLAYLFLRVPPYFAPSPLTFSLAFGIYFVASRICSLISLPTLVEMSAASSTWAGLIVLASPF